MTIVTGCEATSFLSYVGHVHSESFLLNNFSNNSLVINGAKIDKEVKIASALFLLSRNSCVLASLINSIAAEIAVLGLKFSIRSWNSFKKMLTRCDAF